jgi:hypothetical protein
MSSEKRIAASRANGARSRGPKTLQGKARSSQNAITHGFFAKAVVIRHEDRQAFERTRQSYIRRFHPTGEAELAQVEQMAAARWRGSRALAFESTVLAQAIKTGAGRSPHRRIAASLDNPAILRKLELATRRQARYASLHSRAMREFFHLRKSGPQLQRSQNEPKDPFVCNPETHSGEPTEPTVRPVPAAPALTQRSQNEPTLPFRCNAATQSYEPTDAGIACLALPAVVRVELPKVAGE